MRITRHQNVSPAKLQLAKQMRKAMTPEERVLWRALRNNGLEGFHFRRQQVIAGFIVDFYCAPARLAVEVDGAAHLRQQHHDSERDRALSELGIQTLRLSNSLVAEDLAAALSRIVQAANSSSIRKGR